jgi:hypothetical protein
MAANQFIEDYRQHSWNHINSMGVFAACWPTWHRRMTLITENWSDADAIFNLGSQLREVFALTAVEGRTQDSVSGGGAAWEGLVCWYLNLILSGTNAVAIKQRKDLLPQCVQDAGTISYGSFKTNTESDLVILVIPQRFDSEREKFNLQILNDYISRNFSELEMHIVQCKTNWNDNAQIPMLWDMIYHAKSFIGHPVTIGRSGYNISRLKRFTYSFVTMPSQSKPIKAGSMAVNRVAKLSGGNFWGKPSVQGVALSLSEIFNRNLPECFASDVKTHIRNCIQNGVGMYAKL